MEDYPYEAYKYAMQLKHLGYDVVGLEEAIVLCEDEPSFDVIQKVSSMFYDFSEGLASEWQDPDSDIVQILEERSRRV